MFTIHLEMPNIEFAATYLIVGVVLILVSLPLLKRKIPRNRWYGFRLKRAFASDDLWYAINEYGAQRMIVWSFALIGVAVLALLMPMQGNPALLAVFALAAALMIIPAYETYIFARKLQA